MILPFPQDSKMIAGAFEVFRGTRESLFLIAPIVFLVRVLINMITMQGHVQHTRVLGDTVLFFFGIYALESLLLLVMDIPASAAELISNKQGVVLDNVPDKFWIMSLAIGTSDLMDFFTTVVFHILSIVYLLFMSLAIMVGGYVVFFATLFQVRKAFTIFVMLIFFLSLWPFLWYSLDKVFEHVLKIQNENASALGAAVSVVMFSLLKLLVPLAGFVAAAKAPVGMLAAAKTALQSGIARPQQAMAMAGRSVGLPKVVGYYSEPIKTSASNRISKAKSILEKAAPYAAYKASQVFGRNKDVSFQSYDDKISGNLTEDTKQTTDTKNKSNQSKESKKSKYRSRHFISDSVYKDIDRHFRQTNSYSNIRLSEQSINELKSSKTTISEHIASHKKYQYNLKVRSGIGAK